MTAPADNTKTTVKTGPGRPTNLEESETSAQIDRLGQLLDKTGIGHTVMSSLLGLSKTAVRGYLERGPSKNAVMALKRELGVNPDWLLSGTGEMFESGPEPTPEVAAKLKTLPKKPGRASLDPEEAAGRSARLREFVDVMGGEYLHIAKTIGKSPSTFYVYFEKGPSDAALELMHEHYGLNPNWILTGEGEMFEENAKSTPEAQRLRSLAAYFEMTSIEMSVALGFSKSAYEMFMREGITANLTERLVSECGVNPDWLRTGDGSMIVNGPSAEFLAHYERRQMATGRRTGGNAFVSERRARQIERLKTIMARMGWSATETAIRLNITQSVVTNALKRGISSTVQKALEDFGFRTDWLVNGEGREFDDEAKQADYDSRQPISVADSTEEQRRGRIQAVCDAFGVSHYLLGNYCGLSNGLLFHSVRNGISASTINTLHDKLGVSKAWLAAGTEPVFESGPSDDLLAQVRDFAEKPARLRKPIGPVAHDHPQSPKTSTDIKSAIPQIDIISMRTNKEMADYSTDNFGNGKTIQSVNEDAFAYGSKVQKRDRSEAMPIPLAERQVLYVPIAAVAGFARSYGTPEQPHLTTIQLPAGVQADICFTVQGDSMAPTLVEMSDIYCVELPKGQWAELLPRSKRGIYVVHFDDSLLIKRAVYKQGLLSLLSDNPDYEERSIAIERVRHIWKVTSSLQRHV